MAPKEISVSIVGGAELDRAALAALVANLPGLRVVSIEDKPQVLLWQTRTSTEGLPAVPAGTSVLLLTDGSDFKSLPEEVAGLFSRDEPPAALGPAIRQVARGEQYLSRSLATAVLQKRESQGPLTESQQSVVGALTDREREILNCLAEGLGNKAIAARLYLSVRTVEGHLANIYSRLGIHSRTEAMLIAIKIR